MNKLEIVVILFGIFFFIAFFVVITIDGWRDKLKLELKLLKGEDLDATWIAQKITLKKVSLEDIRTDEGLYVVTQDNPQDRPY